MSQPPSLSHRRGDQVRTGSDPFAAEFEALRCHVERLEHALMEQFSQQFTPAESRPVRLAKAVRSNRATCAVPSPSELICRSRDLAKRAFE